MTSRYVPLMVERGGGAVLNIGSGFSVGLTPPGFAAYNANKHFIPVTRIQRVTSTST